jgi:hypothetical protein
MCPTETQRLAVTFDIGPNAGRSQVHCDATTGYAAVQGCFSDVGVISSQRRISDRQ